MGVVSIPKSTRLKKKSDHSRERVIATLHIWGELARAEEQDWYRGLVAKDMIV